MNERRQGTEPAMEDPPTNRTAADLAGRVARIADENRRLIDRLAAGERRFRSLSRRVIRMQEADRGRISRELHDSVGQALTALKMQLELLERGEAAGHPALASALADLRGLADHALQDVRHLSHLLRPRMLDDLGLAPTLRWFVRTFQARTGIQVDLREEGLDGMNDSEIATLIYRIVQEALTNVARHGRAPSASVRVRADDRTLTLTVEDRGCGFDVTAAFGASGDPAASGIRGMRDRVQLFGGDFSLSSAPGAGTRVLVHLRLDEQEREA